MLPKLVYLKKCTGILIKSNKLSKIRARFQVECKQVMAQSHVVERPESMCPPSKPPASKPCHTKGCVQDTSRPTIITSETTYIQHDPKKKKARTLLLVVV